MGAALSELHPWTEPIDVIVRWRRFALVGTASMWAAIVLGALFWPRTIVCEATLALPNVSYADEKRPEDQPERLPKPGIPVGVYKKLESSIADAELLTAAFKDKLSEKELRDLRENLKRLASPLTSGARDEIARTERDDTVTGVRLTYSHRDAEKAEMVLTTLATLIGDQVATLIAQDRIEAAVLESTTAARAALAQKLDLAAKNESLGALASDLRKLAAGVPASGDSRREVVDVNKGGYRFLPPALQVVGAKALEADNSHEIRLAEWHFRVESIRVAFFRRLDSRIRESAQHSETGIIQDLPSLIDSEAKAFLSQRSGAEADHLRAEVEGLRDVLQSHRATTTFVQRPSRRTMARTPWIVTALVASALAVLLTALLGESWLRYHQETSSVA